MENQTTRLYRNDHTEEVIHPLLGGVVPAGAVVSITTDVDHLKFDVERHRVHLEHFSDVTETHGQEQLSVHVPDQELSNE